MIHHFDVQESNAIQPVATVHRGSGVLAFTFEPGAVNESAPLIYLWEIADSDGVIRYRYVGKAQGGAERPLRHYARNVKNLLAGRPYRRGKPDGFRLAHRRLADAACRGWSVRLRLLCNVSASQNIFEVEQECHGRHAIDVWLVEPPTT